MSLDARKSLYLTLITEKSNAKAIAKWMGVTKSAFTQCENNYPTNR